MRTRDDLLRVAWTIDGRPVQLAGWKATADRFGYKSASGFVTGRDARRIEQGSILKGWRYNGKPFWEGRLAENPLVVDGMAEITATGYQAAVAKSTGRLLYQTRDYGLWTTVDAEPFNRTWGSQPKFVMGRGAGRLSFKNNKAEVMANNDAHGFMFAVRGSPGGITRLAADWVTNALQFADLKLFGATWLNVGLALIATQGLGAAASGSVAWTTTAKEQLELQVIYNNATTLAQPWEAVVRNLRINGIAPGDTFTDSQVVSDIGTRAGFDVSGVEANTLNVLPYDLTGGSWLEGLAYMAMLADRQVRILDDAGAGPRLEYGSYERTWGMTKARSVRPELRALELYNVVKAVYQHAGGFTDEIKRDAADLGAVDPLAAKGIVNEAEISLGDVQGGDALAIEVADAHLGALIVPRFAGTLAFMIAVSPEGIVDPLGVLPGDVGVLLDFGPGKSQALRLDTVAWAEATPPVATVEESRNPAEGIINRARLAAGRLPSMTRSEEAAMRAEWAAWQAEFDAAQAEAAAEAAAAAAAAAEDALAGAGTGRGPRQNPWRPGGPGKPPKAGHKAVGAGKKPNHPKNKGAQDPWWKKQGGKGK